MALVPLQTQESLEKLQDYRRLKTLQAKERKLEREHKRLLAEVRRVEKARNEMTWRLRNLNAITHVISGVLIASFDTENTYGPGFRIQAPALNRVVEAYTGADGKSGMGLSFKDYNHRTGAFEMFQGLGWRWAEAKYASIMWLVYDQPPGPGEELRRRWLFKNDPEGRWTPRKRMAMEAAWRLGG